MCGIKLPHRHQKAYSSHHDCQPLHPFNIFASSYGLALSIPPSSTLFVIVGHWSHTAMAIDFLARPSLARAAAQRWEA
eukprot:5403770-Amphidinium_carterae.1